MITRAEIILQQIDEILPAALGIVGSAAIHTAGQQLLAKKRREEKVRQAGHGDELDSIKKKRLQHEKSASGKLLVGKKKKEFKSKRAELKSQHQKVVNKGLAGHAKLLSGANKKAQDQMGVK